MSPSESEIAPSMRTKSPAVKAVVLELDQTTASNGSPPVERGWPQRYAARRIAWHALDHAWEIEDRSDPAGG